MNAVLAAIFHVPSQCSIDTVEFEWLGEINAAQVGNVRNDLRRAEFHVWPGTVIVAHKVLPVFIDRAHHVETRLFASRGGGRGKNASCDNARKQMPGLGQEANPDGQFGFADRRQKWLQLGKGTLRERAGRLEKDLQFHFAVTELDRFGMFCVLCSSQRVFPMAGCQIGGRGSFTSPVSETVRRLGQGGLRVASRRQFSWTRSLGAPPTRDKRGRSAL